jgi:hypothetical protein
MAYEYDIFISYKRHIETLHWIKKHLEPLLKSEVGLARGHVPMCMLTKLSSKFPRAQPGLKRLAKLWARRDGAGGSLEHPRGSSVRVRY